MKRIVVLLLAVLVISFAFAVPVSANDRVCRVIWESTKTGATGYGEWLSGKDAYAWLIKARKNTRKNNHPIIHRVECREIN